MNYTAIVLFVADAAAMWLHNLNTTLNIVYA